MKVSTLIIVSIPIVLGLQIKDTVGKLQKIHFGINYLELLQDPNQQQ